MQTVKICYVGGEFMENKFMSLAPYHLVGCLRDCNIEAEVYEITPENFEDVNTLSPLIDQDIVGFSCNTFTYPFALSVLRKLKAQSPKTTTVMGGLHVLHSYAEILQQEPVDYIIRGEADRSLPALVVALRTYQSFDQIPGLVFRKPDGFLQCNPTDTPSLDSNFSLPAYDLLPQTPRILIFETSRGCPFRCTFCSIDQTSRWRGWEPAAVVDRFVASASRLKDQQSLRNVMFGDDNFATNQLRASTILSELHRLYPNLILSFETRAREVLRDPLLVRTCFEENIRTSFLFGIECGYEEGLRRIRKVITVDEIRQCAKLVYDYGMQEGAVFSYIIGFPWESKRERMLTLKLAEELYEVYGVKSTCFYWLPAPSAMQEAFNIQVDYSIPFWWRNVQIEMNKIVSDEEADLMAKVNSNGNFSETRIDDTSKPGRSPRELPPR